MVMHKFFHFLLCILTFHWIRDCSPMTNVLSEKSRFAVCLTSKDNLIGLVDPRKLMKYIDEAYAFKIQLVKTRQYYKYCGDELKVEVKEFANWIDYTVSKVNLEIEFVTAITHLIQRNPQKLDVVHLDMNLEPLDEKIIRKSFKEIRLIKNYLTSGESTKCVKKLQKIYEVSDSILGRYSWLRKLYYKIFRKEDSSEEFTTPKIKLYYS